MVYTSCEIVLIGYAVIQVQADGVSYIFDRLFVGLTLAIAPLQSWARNKIAIIISFQNDRKGEVFHKQIIGWVGSYLKFYGTFKADAKGNETEVPVNDWIDIGAFAQPAKGKKYGDTLYRERVHITQKNSTYTFTTPSLPEKAGIDPFALLIDRVPDDNMKNVTVSGSSAPPAQKAAGSAPGSASGGLR